MVFQGLCNKITCGDPHPNYPSASDLVDRDARMPYRPTERGHTVWQTPEERLRAFLADQGSPEDVADAYRRGHLTPIQRYRQTLFAEYDPDAEREYDGPDPDDWYDAQRDRKDNP